MNQALLQGLLHRHLAAENQHDLPATLETLHPDCIFEDCATGQRWSGRAEVADHYTQWWRAFDITVGHEPSQAGGWVSPTLFVGEATWRGTHIGDYLSIAPTQRKIALPFVVFVGFKDELLAEERFYYDRASLLAQLGAWTLPDLASVPHHHASSAPTLPPVTTVVSRSR